MNSRFISMALALPILMIGATARTAAAAPIALAPADGTYSAPDNQPATPQAPATTDHQVVASNAAGTTDKTLVLTPKTGSDATFTVVVFNARTGEVIDTIEYSPGNTPPVVVPPGAKAAVQDDPDVDKTKPEGSSKFT